MEKRILQESVKAVKDSILDGKKLKSNYTLHDKNKLIAWLKNGKPGWVCAKVMTDPLTDEVYSWGNTMYTRDEYLWTDEVIHLIDTYGAPVSEELLRKITA